jgi:hypothetical protein
MRSIPTTLALGAALLALAGPAPAAAEEAEQQALLAAPGKCAEPRRFQGSGACADCTDAAGAENGGFDVAGPVRSRFSPADVAASAAPGSALAPPDLGGFDGRGPCDSPGSGCLGTVAPAPAGPSGPSGGRGVTVVERPPNPGGPPGR